MAKQKSTNPAPKTTKKRKNARKPLRRDPDAPKYSYIVKPKDLTLEQWQIALRKQIALKENFIIRSIDDREHDRHGYYSIRKVIYESLSLHKGHDDDTVPQPMGFGPEHTVVYRGEGSKWNYCSCMDFKTSALGTCKHIEAVKMWIYDNNQPLKTSMPQASALYIDYKDNRKIKLRLGVDNLDEIKALAESYFDADGVPFTDEPDTLIDFIQKVQEISPSFRCYDDVIELLNEKTLRRNLRSLSKEVDDNLINSLLKTNLYPYQLEGIKFAFSKSRSIIADEMGLGKTLQAIGTAELLKHFHLASSVLIVCPTSLKYQWKFEIEKFTNSTVTVIEGTPPKRKKLYDTDDSFYKIVSYNTMANDIKYNGELSADLVIMDEVQRLKNWNTIIAKAARHLKSSFSVILSGTPLENKLEELFSIVELVDQYYLGPYYRFRNDYIKTNEDGMTIGYVNLNSIGERLKGILIRRQKKDVALQMPRRQDKTLYVPMTLKQRAAHMEMEARLSFLIQRWKNIGFLSELDRQRLLLILGQMRMVANSTFILDQKTRHDTKIDETMSILEDILESSNEKVVIFSGWERMTRLIAMELDKMEIKYSYLHGGIPSAKRRGLVENFTTDPECRVFLSTDAGATGLNLQAGSTIINLELPWNPAVLEQRIGRIYRLGQMKNIQVINMVSIGSIENAIEQKIKFKSALFEGILDNGEDSVFLPDKNKFEQLMESLSEFMGQTDDKTAKKDTEADIDSDLEDDTLETPITQHDAQPEGEEEIDAETDQTDNEIDDTEDQDTDSETETENETDVNDDTDEDSDTDETSDTEEDKNVREEREDSDSTEETDKSDSTANNADSNVTEDKEQSETSEPQANDTQVPTDTENASVQTKDGENSGSSDSAPVESKSSEGSESEDPGSDTQSTIPTTSSSTSTTASSSSSNSEDSTSSSSGATGGHTAEQSNDTEDFEYGSESDLRSSNEEKAEREMMDQDDVQEPFGTAAGATDPRAVAVPSSPSDLVAQGISFFSGLAKTLSSPQKTKELVDTIVKTDEKTGRTTLEIPVPDKATVNNLLSTIGALFANIGR